MRELWAWMQMAEGDNRPASRASYDANGAGLSGVRPVNGGNCTDEGEWQQAPSLYDATLKAAVHAAGQLYMPTVGVSSPADFQTVLDSSALSATAISNLVTLATEREHDGPWDGVDFSLEGIDNSYKSKLTAWYEDVIPMLQAEGLQVNITSAPPRTVTGPEPGTLAHDLSVLGRLADTITLMLYAYDSYGYMHNAIDYVLSIGLDSSIVLAGLSTTSHYKTDGAWSHISYAYAQDVLTGVGASPRWWELADDGRRVSLPRATWDSDEMRVREDTTLRILLNFVDEFGLAGACPFVLGSEAVATWNVLADWQAGATHWHGYIALERVDMAADDFTTFLDYAKAQGQRYNDFPNRLTHWRTVDANTIVIEAEWGNGEITAGHCDDWLGELLDINTGDIGHTESTVVYVTRETPITLFSYDGTDYLRLRILGGLDATWEQSRNEVLGYL